MCNLLILKGFFNLCFSHTKGTKCFLKESVSYLPVIGWSFSLMEFPMLKRNWEKDKRCLAESSARLADYPVNMLVSYITCKLFKWREFKMTWVQYVLNFCKEICY